MRIIDGSTDLLVVTESATGMRMAGGVVAIAGASLMGAGAATNSTAASIAGAITLAIGAAFALLPSITTFSFNRRNDQLVVQRRRLWQPLAARTAEIHALGDVAAVQVDESASDEGGSTWRVIVSMRDGRSIPFTSYYTSGYQPKLDAAERIRAFLGVASVTNSFGGRSSPHAIAPSRRGMTMGIAVIIMLAGVLFGSIGGVMLTRELRRMTTWQPVQATVLETRVDTHSDADGSTYLPVVTYRYAVGDQHFTSSATLPINESRSGRWAHRVVRQFTPGQQYTAWYDPAHPGDAFIVRSHSVVAPAFTALGVLALVAGLAAAISARRERDL